MPSPVVPVPGVGQVGQGLQNTWGLEEEDEEEENDNSGEDEEVKETKMEVEQHDKEGSKQGYYISFFNIKRNVHPKTKIQSLSNDSNVMEPQVIIISPSVCFTVIFKA